MEQRFYGNLSSIFRVLLHEPSSIVDDTAVERLLLMLQNYSQSRHDDDFIRICIAFWENDVLWDNGVSTSFALRSVNAIEQKIFFKLAVSKIKNVNNF